jgi:hypothetical protein
VRAVVGVLVGTQIALGGVAFAVAVAPRLVGWVLVVLTAAAGAAALAFFLRQPEWTPPAHEEMSRDVALALGRTLDAIALFEEAAASSGLAGADPGTMRALRDGARRLDAIRSRVTGSAEGSPTTGSAEGSPTTGSAEGSPTTAPTEGPREGSETGESP